MNYQKIYNQLIEKRQQEKLFKKKGYCCETHHIVPTCMGGSNDKNNKVNLFPKEHLLAHLLLCKIYPENYKLLNALYLMTETDKSNKYKISIKKYEWIKNKYYNNYLIKSWEEKFGKEIADKMKINQSKKKKGTHKEHYGEERAKEIGNKISSSLKNLFINGYIDPKLGKNKDKNIYCEYCNKNFDAGNFKRWHGENCLLKPGNEKIIRNRSYSEILKQKNSWKMKREEGYISPNKNKPNKKRICEWCNKIIDFGNYSQYHGDNCKKKPGNENIKRTNSLKGRKFKKILCEYCGKETILSNYNKYHGDNCKKK